MVIGDDYMMIYHRDIAVLCIYIYMYSYINNTKQLEIRCTIMTQQELETLLLTFFKHFVGLGNLSILYNEPQN